MFTEDYYLKIIAQYGYNPLRFNNINFTFPGIDEIEMRNMWLCSYNIDSNFSGFYSQGDGASFSANYRYKKGCLKCRF